MNTYTSLLVPSLDKTSLLQNDLAQIIKLRLVEMNAQYSTSS